MKKRTISKKAWKKLLLLTLCAIVSVGCFTGAANLTMIRKVSPQILSEEQAVALTDVDCILVLGCKVHADGTPSNRLRDRLVCGTDLYLAGASPKLLMSGDHGRKEYDEVGTMKKYAMDRDIPSEDIFMDHAGFSTYESMYRAKEIFGADKILIVTQEYHLYRALYVADCLGIEAYGVASRRTPYQGQWVKEDVREVLARTKDFVKCIFRPKPTCLGEAIPISGNGDETNDVNFS